MLASGIGEDVAIARQGNPDVAHSVVVATVDLANVLDSGCDVPHSMVMTVIDVAAIVYVPELTYSALGVFRVDESRLTVVRIARPTRRGAWGQGSYAHSSSAAHIILLQRYVLLAMQRNLPPLLPA
jgi:hypothetical protein